MTQVVETQRQGGLTLMLFDHRSENQRSLYRRLNSDLLIPGLLLKEVTGDFQARALVCA